VRSSCAAGERGAADAPVAHRAADGKRRCHRGSTLRYDRAAAGDQPPELWTWRRGRDSVVHHPGHRSLSSEGGTYVCLPGDASQRRRCADVVRAFNGHSANADAYARGLLTKDPCCYPSAKEQQLIAQLLVATVRSLRAQVPPWGSALGNGRKRSVVQTLGGQLSRKPRLKVPLASSQEGLVDALLERCLIWIGVGGDPSNARGTLSCSGSDSLTCCSLRRC
jgi:hypothetical protein